MLVCRTKKTAKFWEGMIMKVYSKGHDPSIALEYANSSQGSLLMRKSPQRKSTAPTAQEQHDEELGWALARMGLKPQSKPIP